MTDGLGVRRTAGGQSAAGDDDVTHFLTELRALGDGPSPEPSREVAALIAGAHPFFGRRLLVQLAVRTALVAALVVGLLIAAAASHSLPQPAQKVVSHVVNVLTPFHIDPRDLPASTVPTPPPVRPTPSHPVSPSPSHPRSSEPEAGDGGETGESRGSLGGVGSDDGAGSGSRSDDRSSDDGGGQAGSDDGVGGGPDDGRRTTNPNRPAPSSSPTPRDDDGESGDDG